MGESPYWPAPNRPLVAAKPPDQSRHPTSLGQHDVAFVPGRRVGDKRTVAWGTPEMRGESLGDVHGSADQFGAGEERIDELTSAGRADVVGHFLAIAAIGDRQTMAA